MAIEILRRSGLNVFAKDGGTLLVSPKERITDEIREFIRRHKEQVIAELERESRSADARCGHCVHHRRDELTSRQGFGFCQFHQKWFWGNTKACSSYIENSAFF